MIYLKPFFFCGGGHFFFHLFNPSKFKLNQIKSFAQITLRLIAIKEWMKDLKLEKNNLWVSEENIWIA